MKTKNNILILILSILLGGIFLFSAYSKTVPNLQSFEYTFVNQLKFPQMWAAIAARFFIGLEAALGLLLISMIFGKRKWVLKGSMLLLIIFSIHLTLIWIFLGNDVDCGCMGTLVAMSPFVSLLKNAGLIIGTFLLLKYYKQGAEKTQDVLAIIVLVGFIIAPFFIFPMQKQASLILKSSYFDQNNMPKAELNKGKKVICFMSLTCSHCRDAAKKIHEMSISNPEIPFYFIFPKAENDSIQAIAFEDFMQDTKDIQIPYSFIDYKTFVELLNAAGETGVPSIFWVSDSTIIRKVTEPELNQKEIEAWLKK